MKKTIINGHEVYPIFIAELEGSIYDGKEKYEMVIVTKWTDRTNFAKELGRKVFYFKGIGAYGVNINDLVEDETWCKFIYEEFKEHKRFDFKKSLLEMLLEAKYPKEDMHNHFSDLYVFVNKTTTSVIKEWYGIRNYNMDWHCPKFKDQVTGKLMYDCAFQYYEID